MAARGWLDKSRRGPRPGKGGKITRRRMTDAEREEMNNRPPQPIYLRHWERGPAQVREFRV